jgi:hypothetical protein
MPARIKKIQETEELLQKLEKEMKQEKAKEEKEKERMERTRGAEAEIEARCRAKGKQRAEGEKEREDTRDKVTTPKEDEFVPKNVYEKVKYEMLMEEERSRGKEDEGDEEEMVPKRLLREREREDKVQTVMDECLHFHSFFFKQKKRCGYGPSHN